MGGFDGTYRPGALSLIYLRNAMESGVTLNIRRQSRHAKSPSCNTVGQRFSGRREAQ